MVPRERSLCSAVVADTAHHSKAQLHRGATRPTPPAHARDEVRARSALLHGSPGDRVGPRRRDDVDVVRERAVRDRLRVGAAGRGRGDARGAVASAAPARGRLWPRGLAGARARAGRPGGRGAVRARTEAPPVRLFSWGSPGGRGPCGAQRGRKRRWAQRGVRDGGFGADARDPRRAGPARGRDDQYRPEPGCRDIVGTAGENIHTVL